MEDEALRVGDDFPNVRRRVARLAVTSARPQVSCNTTHGIITSMHQHFGSHWALVVTQPEEGNAVVGSAASPRK